MCVCVCVCVGGNGKQLPLTHRLSYESGSKLTARWLDLISSHRISDSNLFLLRERRDARPFSIYVTMTMQRECVILKGPRRVCCHPILYICSPSSTQRSLSRRSLTEQKLARWTSLHKQRCVYKRRFVSGVRSSFSLCLSSAAHRWVGKLGAYSALCSSSVDKSNSHRSPSPTLSPPAFYRPPSHFHYCFYLILQPISSPTRPPSLQPLQTTSCLC